MAQKIDIKTYIMQVKKNMNLDVSEEIIEKDLILTFVLAEFQKKKGVFNELIFKGGTLLSRNYLKYHRFSEDLDFSLTREVSEVKKEITELIKA